MDPITRRFALLTFLSTCGASPLSADVIWRGAGTVTSNTAAFIQAPVGSSISWAIEFGEVSPGANPGNQQQPLSIRILDRLPQPPPALAVIPGIQADLQWPVPSVGRFRLERSEDLRTYFTVDEAERAGPVASFTDPWSAEGRAFYRLFRLDTVFVAPPPQPPK